MQVTPLNEQSSHEVLYNNSVIHSNEVDSHFSFKLTPMNVWPVIDQILFKTKLKLMISYIPSYGALELHSLFSSWTPKT